VAASRKDVETPNEVWVIDTCSVIEIRRRIPATHHALVYTALAEFVAAGSLVFPHEVYGELKRDNTPDRLDPPFEWAAKNVAIAARHGTDFEAVKRALAKTPKVLDHEKPSGADEADPYVLALALTLKTAGHETTVITEERKDRPQKMSLNTACGLHRLFCVPILAFLASQDIWSPTE
jgi:hypothetical protein